LKIHYRPAREERREHISSLLCFVVVEETEGGMVLAEGLVKSGFLIPAVGEVVDLVESFWIGEV
jgi:hypothetical protein